MELENKVNQELIERAISALRQFEAIVPCMYKDTESVISTGIGHALFTQDDALLLPWALISGPASPKDIIKDYQAVKAAEPGHTWQHYEPLTACWLLPADIDGLCQHDLTVRWAEFLRYYPQADEYPAPAIQALLDLTFNLGAGWPVVEKNGAKVWPHLAAAVLANDWATCAVQSHRPQVNADRNLYVKTLFLRAATGV